jgi:hypothetical protein
MLVLRRGFYLIVGFTFPGFWLFHAAGYGASLYRPIQLLFQSTAVGWPSLITATLLYLAIIGCFEACWRLLKHVQP